MNFLLPVAQGHRPRPIRGALLARSAFARGSTPAAMRLGLNTRVPRRAPRRAFTLIEMLVALVITLIMMGAVVTLFGVISQSVADSRAAIEMSDRLRLARNQLQHDLAGATATMQPPLRPENDEGYFEIIEGSRNDKINGIEDGTLGNSDDHLLLFGDTDDVLMFTTRTRGAPFLGKYNPTLNSANTRIIESPVAEVVYFLVQNGPVIDATTATPTRLCTLYRRVFLVAPGLPAIPTFDNHFYDMNDLSIRYEEPGGTPVLIPNTLGDLTKRENRFAHYGNAGVAYGGFPFPVDLRGIPQISTGWPPIDVSSTALPGSWPPGRTSVENAFLAPYAIDVRIGDDVLLGNVLSFDVQVWDPGAPIFVLNNVAVEPSDPGWRTAVFDWIGAGSPLPPDPRAPVGFGAYVDIFYGSSVPYVPLAGMPATLFFPVPQPRSRLATPPAIYDTWSLHYENDGLDEDVDTLFDEGTNGLDDDNDGMVDELDLVTSTLSEYETHPPYPAPLRGVRVTIRVYEPDSQQVREAVVIQDFLPE